MTAMTQPIKANQGSGRSFRILKFRMRQLKRLIRRYLDDIGESETMISMVFFIIGVSFVIASLAFIPQTSFAAGTGMNNSVFVPPRHEADLPRQHMVPVVMGGVGDDEAQALKKAEGHYSLKLLFTSMKGMYLSNANVLLEDKRGNIYVNDEVDGPVLLVDLEPGSYRLTVQYDGKVQVRNINIRSKQPTTVQIRYAIEEDGAGEGEGKSGAVKKLQTGWHQSNQAGGLCLSKTDYQPQQDAGSCAITQNNP